MGITNVKDTLKNRIGASHFLLLKIGIACNLHNFIYLTNLFSCESRCLLMDEGKVCMCRCRYDKCTHHIF